MRSLHPPDAEHKGFGHSPTSILNLDFEKSDSKIASWYQLALLAATSEGLSALANKFIVFPCARFYSTIGIGHGSLTAYMSVLETTFVNIAG